MATIRRNGTMLVTGPAREDISAHEATARTAHRLAERLDEEWGERHRAALAVEETRARLASALDGDDVALAAAALDALGRLEEIAGRLDPRVVVSRG